MRDAYSECFCRVHRPGSPLAAFTVPAGRRAVVRSLVYSGYLTTSAAIFLQIAGFYVYAALPPGATFGGNVDMYQVAYVNEVVALDATAQAGDVWAAVSGYLLTDEPGAAYAGEPGELEPLAPWRQPGDLADESVFP